MSDDNKSRRLGPICALPTGYGIKDSGDRPGAPGVSLRKKWRRVLWDIRVSFGTDGGHICGYMTLGWTNYGFAEVLDGQTYVCVTDLNGKSDLAELGVICVSE